MTTASTKILVVDNSTWNLYNFRSAVLRGILRSGFQVVSAAPPDAYLPLLRAKVHAPFRPLRHLRPPGRNPLRDLLFLLELWRLFRSERPSLVLLYTIKPNLYGNLAARLLGIPTVSVVTGLGYPMLHGGWLNRLLLGLLKSSLSWVRRLVVYNHSDALFFTGRGIVAPEKCRVIPGSGVDTNRLRPLKRPDSHGGLVFLFAGRLLYDKGLKELAAAVRELRREYPQAECWVAGDLHSGNPAAVPPSIFQGWVLEGLFRYFGHVFDLRTLMRHADTVVLPSYREGIPRALTEAMSMGLPVIATQVPGCRELVERGRNGFLVPPRSASHLAEAMKKMARLSPEVRRAMGREGRRLVLSRYDQRLTTRMLLKECLAVLSSRRHVVSSPGSRPVLRPAGAGI